MKDASRSMSIRKLAAPALLIAVSVMIGGSSFYTAGPSAVRADALRQQAGAAVCLPKPLVEPPPPPRAVAGVQDQRPALERRRPCPEGFVPQPIERHVPRVFSDTASLNSGTSSRAVSAPAPASDYFYAGGYQNAVGAGAAAFLTQHKPLLAPNDFHTLAEIAVQSADHRQVVEVGWTVNRSLNGDDLPHLFVYHWVNGAPTCYNGCGWVQFSAALLPGMEVASDGTGRQYMIFLWQGNWWVGYEGEWIGYFPGALWNGVFTSSGLVQWFGEIAAQQGVSPPLSSMGNGMNGSSGSLDAAQVYFAGLFNNDGSTRPAMPALMNHFTYATRYNAASPVGQCMNCFRYGGAGGL